MYVCIHDTRIYIYIYIYIYVILLLCYIMKLYTIFCKLYNCVNLYLYLYCVYIYILLYRYVYIYIYTFGKIQLSCDVIVVSHVSHQVIVFE